MVNVELERIWSGNNRKRLR